MIESPTTTICMNDDKGTAVECDNDGKCFGTAPRGQIGNKTLLKNGETTSTKSQLGRACRGMVRCERPSRDQRGFPIDFGVHAIRHDWRFFTRSTPSY